MRRRLCLMGVVLSLGGCVQTSYSGYENPAGGVPGLSRNVRFEVTDAFYRDPPICLTVLPVSGVDDDRVTRMVELAAARHLSGKVKRVIGPRERQGLERRLAFDLQVSGDRRRFASQQRCPHFAQPVLAAVNESYALVWARRQVEITLQIHGISGDQLLWRASHRASRGDGGLPLSPLSLGAAMFSAGRAHSDTDSLPSMVDDSLRRMLKTLPDTRPY